MKKALWNLAEYFFGAGNNDSYERSKQLYPTIKDNNKRFVEKYSTLIDKVCKITIRSVCTAVTIQSIYSYTKTNNEIVLGGILLSEGFRQISIYYEKKNIKKLEEKLKQS